MKKLPILFFLFLVLSCSQKKSSNASSGSIPSDSSSKKEDTSFIPVTSFLQTEFSSLDSLPVTVLQLSTVNKKSDSAWLPVTKVKPQLIPFLSPLIDKKNMVPFFTESRFNDQSTAAVTFTYNPKPAIPDSFSLRHWDVYFDPDKNAIRKVYIVKRIKENNELLTQQLTWELNKWAQIVIIKHDSIISEKKWIWDLRAE